MEKTTVITTDTTPARQAAVNGLAVVGFLALVFIGIMLAIYAARYVPSIVDRIAHFGNASGSGLAVVPTTTLPFPGTLASSTPATTTPAFLVPAATSTKPVTTTKPAQSAPVVGYRTVITPYPTPGSVQLPATTTQNLSGLPNLTAKVTAVGYIDNNDNFVADRTINSDQRMAVAFTVTNTGTNVSGDWNLSVEFPTRRNGTFEFDSDPQHSLNPGGVNTYVVSLSKNDARIDTDDEVTVTIDPDHKISESIESDNSATGDISVDD